MRALKLEDALKKERLNPEIIEKIRKDTPKYIRINPRRTDFTNLSLEKLEDVLGIYLSKISWIDCYKVEDKQHRFKEDYNFRKGVYYIQDLASVVPVYALNPQDGEYIADVCAAPGMKAMLIADMAPNGSVLAVEKYKTRLNAFLNNIKKYGIFNIRVHEGDATNSGYASEKGKFDRIIVDPSCPSEGNVTNSYINALKQWNHALRYWDKLLDTAYRLALTAFENLKDGGTMVYSTCTFQTEFNEGVIGRLIHDTGAHLVEVHIPNFMVRTPYHKYMYRIYPQDNETKGQFFVRIRKL